MAIDPPDLVLDARVRGVLRRVKPAKVRAYSADGDSRDISVPLRKNRWQSVGATLGQLGWVRLELMDKSGALLEIVENDGPADNLENMVPSRAPGDATFEQVERIVGLLGRMQDQAVARMAQMFAPAFESLREALRITSQREQATMATMVELQQLVDALWERLGTPAAAAPAAAAKKTLSGQVLEHLQDELAPAIAQEVARSAMTTFGVKAPAAPAKPNGHNPPAAPKVG